MSPNITNNYIFRRFICGLSKTQTAKLCFKSVKTVEHWDRGRTIPPECKRLMRLHTGRELNGVDDQWEGWEMTKDEIVTPAGQLLNADQVITGTYLVSLNYEEVRLAKKDALKFSRILCGRRNDSN
ncbi:DUF3653 domain-containing protein [Veronia pacifica]|uniref:Uncharacterized protein n=1 Tax=Veronia pacifica TaxID=1080227 RepID=A0A1C3E989_9GAMM|nr:DUF3653 domain-containing protein [Veronia pacifica]ODA29837.1 hypothetical protein A8L45_21620 [Veronia pacifica]